MKIEITTKVEKEEESTNVAKVDPYFSLSQATKEEAKAEEDAKEEVGEEALVDVKEEVKQESKSEDDVADSDPVFTPSFETDDGCIEQWSDPGE